MARKSRIHYPGAVYHVIVRGNAGNPVFFDDRDRCRLYQFLENAVAKFGCRIHGYCLMTNHIHLVMQTGQVPLSRIMQNISLRYTKWINYRQNRTGHVFQGRYNAVLIDADAYLLQLVRYVHLNPLRAGIADSSNSWPWSGHRAYLGLEKVHWLTTGWVLGMFSSQLEDARQLYASFVEEGVSEERRSEFHRGTCDGRLLGDDCFVDTVLKNACEKRSRTTVADVVSAVCRVYNCSVGDLRAIGKVHPFTEARAIASLVVQRLPHLSLTELGKELSRDIAPLGRVGRRVASAAVKDARLREMLENVRKQLRE